MYVLIVSIAVVSLYVSIPYTAHADVSSQITIAGNGHAIVREALVTAKAGQTLTAVTTWGSTRITWRVLTSGSTRFVPDGDSSETFRAITVGDTISFSGNLDANASQPTVRATVLRAHSLVVESAAYEAVVLPSGGPGNAFTVETEDGEGLTVEVGVATFVTLAGARASLDAIRAGDTISVTGRLNKVTNTLSANRITIAERPEDTVSSSDSSLFSGIVAWFRGGARLLGLR